MPANSLVLQWDSFRNGRIGWEYLGAIAESNMSAEQVSAMAPMIREVLSTDGQWCATFEVSGDPTRWVQFMVGCINASYPFEEPPNDRFGALEGSCLDIWEPNKYAQFQLEIEEARAIAQWIDMYFVNILGCEGNFSIDGILEDLDSK